MRRQLSSLFLLLAIPMLSQPALKEVELSFSFQLNTDKSQLAAYLSFEAFSRDSLALILSQPVDSVKLEQGRLKQKLAFRQKKNTLQVALPPQLDARSRIVVYYPFYWQEGKGPFLQKSAGAWVLNALNLVEKENNFAQPGFFYPVVDNKPHQLKVNLYLPRKLNFELPGTLEYVVRSPEGDYHFTRTEQPFKPEAFYLVLGDFDDAEDFVEDQGLAQELRGNLVALQVEQKIKPALNYFSAQSDRLLVEGDLESIAQVEKYDTSGFFLEPGETDTDSKKFALLKAAALHFTRNDKAKANDLLYRYFRSSLGKAWEAKILGQRLKNYSAQGDYFWEQYLNRVVKNYQENLSLADTATLGAQPQSRIEAYLWFAREMYHRRQPIKVKADYRYLGAQGEQLLLFSQPDSAMQTALPLQVQVYTAQGETEKVYSFIELGLRDTLRIPLAGAPKSVRIGLDSLLPVELTDQRPQTYLLYELSNAQDPAVQQEALLTLLNSSNPALKATVVGIALANKDARVQMRGLQAVKTLNDSGRARVELGVRKLAESTAVPIVQEKAREVLKQHY